MVIFNMSFWTLNWNALAYKIFSCNFCEVQTYYACPICIYTLLAIFYPSYGRALQSFLLCSGILTLKYMDSLCEYDGEFALCAKGLSKRYAEVIGNRTPALWDLWESCPSLGVKPIALPSELSRFCCVMNHMLHSRTPQRAVIKLSHNAWIVMVL